MNNVPTTPQTATRARTPGPQVELVTQDDSLDGGPARTVGRPIAGARSVAVIPGGARVTASPRVTAARRRTC